MLWYLYSVQNNIKVKIRFLKVQMAFDDFILIQLLQENVRIFQPILTEFHVNQRSISSVIRQKGESQNGGYKKTKHVKFSEERKFPFFGKFGVLCFLVTPVLRFAFLPYYQRYLLSLWKVNNVKNNRFMYSLTLCKVYPDELYSFIDSFFPLINVA